MGPNRFPQPVNRRLESNRRLGSWKEIAVFLDCGERTVKRWETERGLPVHRMPGSGRGRVFAYTAELTQWLNAAGPDAPVPAPSGPPAPVGVSPETPHQDASRPPDQPGSSPFEGVRRHLPVWLLAALLVFLCLGALVPVLNRRHPPGDHPASTGAEESYLQGQFYWNKRTPESLRTAVDYFAQAIVRDPNYAPAYVGLADCYNLLREYSAMPASEAYPRALDAARRAVQLDDSLPGAHNALAFVSFYWNWDAPLADREFERAVQLNPNYALAHHWRATFLMVMNRLPEALQEIELARKLDPTSHAVLADKGLILAHMRHFGEAVPLLKQIETQEPGFSNTHLYLAAVHLNTKNYIAFLAESREAATLTQDSQQLAVTAAGEKGFAAGGARTMLESMLVAQQQLYARNKLPAYALAQTSGRLGHQAETLGYLRTSLERMEPAIVAMRIDEALDCVRGDAAYRDILRRFDLGAHR